MNISSFGIIVSIISYLLFPEQAFAQIQILKENNNKITFEIEAEDITVDGFFVPSEKEIQINLASNINSNVLLATKNPVTTVTKPKVKIAKKHIDRPNGPVIITPGKEYQVVATAYSSTVDQTDSSPFITASGTHVHDGTLAANFLKFGSKVQLPDYFGDKVFTVEDRMRDNHKVDVWFPSRGEALKFGVKRTRIVVVN